MSAFTFTLEQLTAEKLVGVCSAWRVFPKPGNFLQFETTTGHHFYAQIETVIPLPNNPDLLRLSLIFAAGTPDTRIRKVTTISSSQFLQRAYSGHQPDIPLPVRDAVLDLAKCGHVAYIQPNQEGIHHAIFRSLEQAHYPLLILDPIGITLRGMRPLEVKIDKNLQFSIQDIGVNRFIDWVVEGLPEPVRQAATELLACMVPSTPDFIPLAYFVQHPLLQNHPLAAPLLHQLYAFHQFHLFASQPGKAINLSRIKGCIHVNLSSLPPELLALAYQGMFTLIFRHHLPPETQVILIAPEVAAEATTTLLSQINHRVFLMTHHGTAWQHHFTDSIQERTVFGELGLEISGKMTDQVTLFFPYNHPDSDEDAMPDEGLASFEHSLEDPPFVQPDGVLVQQSFPLSDDPMTGDEGETDDPIELDYCGDGNTPTESLDDVCVPDETEHAFPDLLSVAEESLKIEDTHFESVAIHPTEGDESGANDSEALGYLPETLSSPPSVSVERSAEDWDFVLDFLPDRPVAAQNAEPMMVQPPPIDWEESGITESEISTAIPENLSSSDTLTLYLDGAVIEGDEVSIHQAKEPDTNIEFAIPSLDALLTQVVETFDPATEDSDSFNAEAESITVLEDMKSPLVDVLKDGVSLPEFEASPEPDTAQQTEPCFFVDSDSQEPAEPLTPLSEGMGEESDLPPSQSMDEVALRLTDSDDATLRALDVPPSEDLESLIDDSDLRDKIVVLPVKGEFEEDSATADNMNAEMGTDYLDQGWNNLWDIDFSAMQNLTQDDQSGFYLLLQKEIPNLTKGIPEIPLLKPIENLEISDDIDPLSMESHLLDTIAPDLIETVHETVLDAKEDELELEAHYQSGVTHEVKHIFIPGQEVQQDYAENQHALDYLQNLLAQTISEDSSQSTEGPVHGEVAADSPPNNASWRISVSKEQDHTPQQEEEHGASETSLLEDDLLRLIHAQSGPVAEQTPMMHSLDEGPQLDWSDPPASSQEILSENLEAGPSFDLPESEHVESDPLFSFDLEPDVEMPSFDTVDTLLSVPLEQAVHRESPVSEPDSLHEALNFNLDVHQDEPELFMNPLEEYAATSQAVDVDSFDFQLDPLMTPTDAQPESAFDPLDLIYASDKPSSPEDEFAFQFDFQEAEPLQDIVLPLDEPRYAQQPVPEATPEPSLPTRHVDPMAMADPIGGPQGVLPVHKHTRPQILVAYQPGEKVVHQRYGQGTIKKVITMNEDQVILNITFEGVGKRLLDPNLTELEKVS